MNWNLISNYIINITSIHSDYKNLELLKCSLQEKNPSFCLFTGWGMRVFVQNERCHTETQTMNLYSEKKKQNRMVTKSSSGPEREK